MNNSQRFWRALFFILIVTALCGGMAFPAFEDAPARAAPQMQTPPVIVINEVAWAGTIASSDDQWIELYNSDLVNPVDISNWRLVSQSGSLDITFLAGTTIAAGGYFLIERTETATSIASSLVTSFPWSLNDTGEVLRLRQPNGTIVDTANGDGGQWPAGSSSPNGSMERYRPLADTDIMWTTNDGTAFSIGTDAASNPIHGTPGAENWAYTIIQTSTTTTITAHTPDPSIPNQDVTVTVTVAGGFETPTGTVEITGTGANAPCTITLASGTGSCVIVFASTGTQSITANYSGDGTHLVSGNTVSHEVVTSTSTTTITADTPDPSAVNGNVTVSVTVTGSSSTVPTGTVDITGTNVSAPCTINLAAGTGSCTVAFTSTGTKTITATYSGDILYPPSSDTESHTVSASVNTSVVISEFRTRGPNGEDDEFIELYNPTSNWVDISGWKINASNDTGRNVSTRATIPASTILRSGQYYLITKSGTGGYSGNVSANLTYSSGITDGGGIALLTSNNTRVDQVGMSAGSAYKEGTILSPLSGTSNRSYERELGGLQDSCQDTNNNAVDFSNISPSNPQNSSFPLSLCGVAQLNPVTTTTTITADTPDPSLRYGYVSVSVRVRGGSTPTGRVSITGANMNCSITLNSSGTGTCTIRFTTTGSKTLTAIYLGDNTHLSSSDTEPHQVTLAAPTNTRVPTLPPPPPLVAINEFVPRPGHDWNLDGVVNTGDEYIEILNHGVIDVNLSGYRLDDEANVGSNPYGLPSVTIKPGERIVFYGSETGLLLSDGGDGVRLLKSNGQLMDAYNYYVVRFPDQSYCRLPDNGGLDDWNQNCFPTPGLQNSLGSAVNPPEVGGREPSCPIADTLPDDFVYAECLPFGHNIWNSAYWDRFGWFDEQYLPNSPGKWPLFAD